MSFLKQFEKIPYGLGKKLNTIRVLQRNNKKDPAAGLQDLNLN